jgi:hypothetical protein
MPVDQRKRLSFGVRARLAMPHEQDLARSGRRHESMLAELADLAHPLQATDRRSSVPRLT